MTGFVFLRVRAHRLLLAAALLAVLLTTSVLAALTAFSGSIGDAGLRRSLGSRDASAAALTIVSSAVTEAQRAEADKVVREAARRTFDGLPTRVDALNQSGTYALPRTLGPAKSRGGEPDLTRFAGLDRDRVRLTAGAWPGAAPTSTDKNAVIEVALPDNAAKELKLTPGPRVITLTDRLSGPARAIRVTGLYEPKKPADPYWKLEELNGRGIRAATFTVYGPLLADPALLRSKAVSFGSVSWMVTADFTSVDTGRIPSLRKAAVSGAAYVEATDPFHGSVAVANGLPQVLDQAQRALLVSRSTLLIVSLQLVLLAGYALLLVARLLSAERAGETSLLIARGGSRQRIVGLSAIEAALLALPAAVLAPVLAGPLTRLLSGQGVLGEIGLSLESGAPTAGIWLVGAAVGAGCALAVVAPAFAAGREKRGRSVPAPMKAGADLALLVIAAVAYWQLDQQTSGTGPLTDDRSGRLGVDPLLVAAPALALLAGTVLTLRLLPPLARLAEKRAASGRALPVALAGWQLSRRPLRGTGPVLLLVLAVAMGMLAIGQGASWNRSQEDQADFRSGASIRVTGNTNSGSGAGAQYLKVPGVTSAAAAARRQIPLSGDRMATLLALDTTQASEGMMLREDLVEGGARGIARQTEGLRGDDKNRDGIPVPRGDRFDLDLTLGQVDGTASKVKPELLVVLEDRYGTAHRVPLGELDADARAHRVPVDLAKAGNPAQPLFVTGLEATFEKPRGVGESLSLSLNTVRSAQGAAVARPRQLDWAGEAVDVLKERDGQPGAQTGLTPGTPDTKLLWVTFDTGTNSFGIDEYAEYTQTSVRLTASNSKPGPLTALATDSFLTSAGAKVGSNLDFDLAGATLTVRIAGTLRQLPTTGPATISGGKDATEIKRDGGGLLLDLRALNREITRRQAVALSPDEWWLGTAKGRTAQAAAALRERTEIDPAQVVVRDETLRELTQDPLGAGPQAALLAVAVVAALLAAVGFAVGAMGSLRERTAEFAVLRALGAPPRQLARLIAAEQSLLIAIALVVGVALGAVLTRAVVPLIVLTGQATQPLPHVLVQLPAGQVAVLLAGVVAVPLLVVLLLALRRGDPATVLRFQGGGN
ncbi:FtsX-like permease family protein [Streptomyces sp. NPDC087440]|uniref:FtsX-like permease family protein n=1 Tax=Streptomyces sp. NPDC087440 TaxID=3365790 RepID=UPI0037FAA08B